MQEIGERTRARRSVPPPRNANRAAAAWRVVYQAVRADIVAMTMRPGDKISENELARRFGVSRTPVREAIQRLADEGLVEIFPQSGTFVARIPYDELPEAIVIRKALEGTTASLAATAASRSQVLTLASVIEQQREAAEADDPDAFHRADELFHAKLADISGHPAIWKLVLQVKTQVDRFRRLTLILPHRMYAVIAEHEQILAAIERGDGGAAAAAMTRHLESVLGGIEAVEDRVDRRAGA
jgi:DNA-binding GntR family transcriptional regulator